VNRRARISIEIAFQVQSAPPLGQIWKRLCEQPVDQHGKHCALDPAFVVLDLAQDVPDHGRWRAALRVKIP